MSEYFFEYDGAFPYVPFEESSFDGHPQTEREAAQAIFDIACGIGACIERDGMKDMQDAETIVSLCAFARDAAQSRSLGAATRALFEVHDLIYIDDVLNPGVKENMLRAIERHSRSTY